MQMCISTLEALVYNGPLRITRITYKANVNCSSLKPILDYLIQNELVEERTLRESKVFYVATPKARTVLSYFNKLKEMLPIPED
jgi:predicted transcriptional regulator